MEYGIADHALLRVGKIHAKERELKIIRIF